MCKSEFSADEKLAFLASIKRLGYWEKLSSELGGMLWAIHIMADTAASDSFIKYHSCMKTIRGLCDKADIVHEELERMKKNGPNSKVS